MKPRRPPPPRSPDKRSAPPRSSIANMRTRPDLKHLVGNRERHGNIVRIDRPTRYRSSRWGNPFRIGPDGTRAEVIARYRAHLWSQIRAGTATLEDLASLHGCIFLCWCAPLACHGEILAVAGAWAWEQLHGNAA